MSTNQTPQNSALYVPHLTHIIISNSNNYFRDTSKETTKPKPKTVSISDESNQQKLPTDNKLCQELCNKLNLSDPNQISEIVRILASTAPHILKEQPSTTNKGPPDDYPFVSYFCLFQIMKIIHVVNYYSIHHSNQSG